MIKNLDILREIRSRYDRAAFLIGNGPNVYTGLMPSWKVLLNDAAGKPLEVDLDGLSNTEVYDLAAMFSGDEINVKKRVSSSLIIQPEDRIHVQKRLMDLAYQTNSPVLTTNFDTAFELSVGADLHYITSAHFSRFYPWKSYYGFEKHISPTDGFGIWKIHGDVRYKDSIRMGLTDYMGSAEKARKLIHSGEGRLFEGKQVDNWQGEQTWLHIWFNMPIIIAGFGFGVDEVFLRWLLIERRRYFNFFGAPMNVCYVSAGDPKPAVKNLLHHLGVEFVKVGSYAEIYGEIEP